MSPFFLVDVSPASPPVPLWVRALPALLFAGPALAGLLALVLCGAPETSRPRTDRIIASSDAMHALYAWLTTDGHYSAADEVALVTSNGAREWLRPFLD